MYISSSLLFVVVLLLFYLTTCVDLLPMHGVNGLLRLLGLFSYILFIIEVEIVNDNGRRNVADVQVDARVKKGGVADIESVIVGNIRLSESDRSELSDLISSLARLYFLLYTSLIFIPFVSLEALMIRVLLA